MTSRSHVLPLASHEQRFLNYLLVFLYFRFTSYHPHFSIPKLTLHVMPIRRTCILQVIDISWSRHIGSSLSHHNGSANTGVDLRRVPKTPTPPTVPYIVSLVHYPLYNIMDARQPFETLKNIDMHHHAVWHWLYSINAIRAPTISWPRCFLPLEWWCRTAGGCVLFWSLFADFQQSTLDICDKGNCTVTVSWQ